MTSHRETAVGIAVSSQLLDRLFQQSVRQVIEPLRYGQAHGRAEDEAGLSRQTLGGLAQQFYTGIGQQGVWAAAGLEPMLDEGREAFALAPRLELHMHLATTLHCGTGRAPQGLRQEGVIVMT